MRRTKPESVTKTWKGEEVMKSFLMVFALVFLGACDGMPAGESPDAGSDTRGSDTLVADTGGYTPNGVTAKLGPNPCMVFTKHPGCVTPDGQDKGTCGWDPATGTCYGEDALSGTTHDPHVCDPDKWCPTTQSPTSDYWTSVYQPGTVKVWGTPNSRYLGDPSGGWVCVMNDQVYTVTVLITWNHPCH